jgi:hypothetical protein
MTDGSSMIAGVTVLAVACGLLYILLAAREITPVTAD